MFLLLINNQQLTSRPQTASAQILWPGLILKSSARPRKGTMIRTKTAIELVMLFSVAAFAIGQAPPTVHQTATQSSCSNIVALSGAKVDCSNLTPEQRKSLADIPAIMKMALENKNYLDAILAKLNEFKEQPST